MAARNRYEGMELIPDHSMLPKGKSILEQQHDNDRE